MAKTARLAALPAGMLDTKIALTKSFASYANGALVFGYKDNAHYRYVRLQYQQSAWKLVLGQVGAIGTDAAGVKKSKALTGLRLGRWYRLWVDVYDTGRVNVWFKTRAGAPAIAYKFKAAAAGRTGTRRSRRGRTSTTSRPGTGGCSRESPGESHNPPLAAAAVSWHFSHPLLHARVRRRQERRLPQRDLAPLRPRVDRGARRFVPADAQHGDGALRGEDPAAEAAQHAGAEAAVRERFRGRAAGIGWVYGPGSIARQVDKGIPRYVDGPNGLDDDADGAIDEADETDTYVGPDGEELVPVGGGVYRARIEGGFARYRKLAAGWEVTLRNGTRIDFGTTAAGRVADAAGERRSSAGCPSAARTPTGTWSTYTWAAYPGSESQKYLREIRYGPGAPPWGAFYFASFFYEDKPDWRADYRSGFLVRTARRLTKIEVGIQGTLPAQCAVGDWNGDGTQDALISRYVIAYDAGAPRPLLPREDHPLRRRRRQLAPADLVLLCGVRPPAAVAADALQFGTENAAALGHGQRPRRDGRPEPRRASPTSCRPTARAASTRRT